jgi:membrane peptidoglycan carboxypeptidase
LILLETARLAAILHNPRRYDPNGNQRYVLNRSKLIYEIMIKRGIVEPDFERAGKAPEETSHEDEPTAIFLPAL